MEQRYIIKYFTGNKSNRGLTTLKCLKLSEQDKKHKKTPLMLIFISIFCVITGASPIRVIINFKIIDVILIVEKIIKLKI